MFNLTRILTYLQESTPTAYNFAQDQSAAVPKNRSSRHTMFALIFVTIANVFCIALIFATTAIVFRIIERRELRERDQGQQDRLATLEIDMMDIRGRILPKSECPALDEDDDFMLPPPAYELHEAIFED